MTLKMLKSRKTPNQPPPPQQLGQFELYSVKTCSVSVMNRKNGHLPVDISLALRARDIVYITADLQTVIYD